MASFSTIACYAALSICSKNDVMDAYSRMVAALVQLKEYKSFTIKELCEDWKKHYGVLLLNQPMETIVKNCINSGFFTYNSSIHQFIPNYSTINSEGFMNIVEEQDAKYKELLNGFDRYLQQEYSMHCSKEDLNDRIVAFIERYGIKATTDKSVIHRVRDDHFFADYLVYCEENGNQDILDYINEYTIGVSLSEIFTYSERPQKYTAKGASVYLDTGVLFRLFGIDSVDYSDNYKQYISNMKKMGIKVKVYEHTVNEMIGLVERSKIWIGNPEYDATLCSETTYYFVTNGWTIEKIDKFSRSIQTRLEDEFKITIDKMSYPKVEDIKTIFEADIKELIIKTYKDSGSTVSTEDIEYSINQDSKSIFYTQHKNGNMVPYHLNDLKNIFVTLNRSLAKVGYILSKEIAVSKDCFIPLVMTDLEWGTLIWFNSPATISVINRPRLVSAAYAAFRPSKELTTKLNKALLDLEKDGKITPEECYFLKTSPVAQRMLTKITANSPEQFIDMTPLEILKEIRKDAFIQGSQSRQEEVDNLEKIKSQYELQIAFERQKSLVSKYQSEFETMNRELGTIQARKKGTQNHLIQLSETANEIEKYTNRKIKHVKYVLTLVAIFFLYLAYKFYKNDAGVLSLIPIIVPILLWIFGLWGKSISTISFISKLEDCIRKKRSKLLHFSPQELIAIQTENSELELKENELIKTIDEVERKLQIEHKEMEKLSNRLDSLESI